MKRPALALAAALGTLLAAQPALAEAVSVQFKDLDLTTDAGQKELDSRIDTAARKVCGFSDLSVGSRIPTKEARDCVAEAKRKIEKRVATLTDRKVAGS
jgi:UrcA family protein